MTVSWENFIKCFQKNFCSLFLTLKNYGTLAPVCVMMWCNECCSNWYDGQCCVSVLAPAHGRNWEQLIEKSSASHNALDTEVNSIVRHFWVIRTFASLSTKVLWVKAKDLTMIRERRRRPSPTTPRQGFLVRWLNEHSLRAIKLGDIWHFFFSCSSFCAIYSTFCRDSIFQIGLPVKFLLKEKANTAGKRWCTLWPSAIVITCRLTGSTTLQLRKKPLQKCCAFIWTVLFGVLIKRMANVSSKVQLN